MQSDDAPTQAAAPRRLQFLPTTAGFIPPLYLFHSQLLQD